MASTMTIHNADIAAIFDEFADLLENHDGNPFRIRAYRNASRTVRSHKTELSSLIAANFPLPKLPGIGTDLSNIIHEIVSTGHCTALDELRAKTPPAFTELLTIPKLGPNRVSMLGKILGVTTIAQLRKAASEGKVRNVPGFGLGTEQQILEMLAAHADQTNRFKRTEAARHADALLAYLNRAPGRAKVIIAGSYRRLKDTIGDLDVLMTGAPEKALMDHFLAYDEIQSVLAHDDTRASVILQSGLQVDLCLTPSDGYGAALYYFTGSKEHNIAMRRLAQMHKLKLNEYGVFRGEERVAGETEESIFTALELPFIDPELRENRGEIEAAQYGQMPQLITLSDLRGDLHMQSSASGGKNTIEEMASAAKALGLDYISITDHFLDPERLISQIDAINKLNKNKSSITILKGAFVDILPDGTLGLPDSLLQQLDVVVAAVNTQLELPGKHQTERILRALDNRYVNILAHPTGRLIGARKPCDLDLPRIMRKAKKRHIAIELNAQPDRLDINDEQCQLAIKEEVLVCINSGARSTQEIANLPYGIDQARRGWLEPQNVLNTRSVEALRTILKFSREL